MLHFIIKSLVTITVITSFLLAQSIYATVYKCVDSNGKVSYQATPCDGGKKSKQLDISTDAEPEKPVETHQPMNTINNRPGVKQMLEREKREKDFVKDKCDLIKKRYQKAEEKTARLIKQKDAYEARIKDYCDNEGKSYCRESGYEKKKNRIKNKSKSGSSSRSDDSDHNYYKIRNRTIQYSQYENQISRAEEAERNIIALARRNGCGNITR